jgi:hypothetical protein
MGVALFGAYPSTGFTADAVIGIDDCHHLALYFVIFFVVDKLPFIVHGFEGHHPPATGF